MKYRGKYKMQNAGLFGGECKDASGNPIDCPQLTPNPSSPSVLSTPNTPVPQHPDYNQILENSNDVAGLNWMMPRLKDHFARLKAGLSTNPYKSAGNEGTDANPMGRGPVDTGPEKTPEKPKVNPFLAMRYASTGASLIGNMVARKALKSYEYNLGRMNSVDSEQFQPLDYSPYTAQQGGMINPFSTYSKYGGNLKKIFAQFKQNQEYSNKAQMDMGDGKTDDQGMMKKGGKMMDKCHHCDPDMDEMKNGGFSLKVSKWRKGGSLTPNKARTILHDGTVHGKPITDKQRRYFGAMSKGHTNFRGK